MSWNAKNMIEEYVSYLGEGKSHWPGGKYIDYETKIFEASMEDEFWWDWKKIVRKKNEEGRKKHEEWVKHN